MSILAYEFVQRALFAAFVTGLAAPAIGTYLVQRRQALMGDGLGHVAVTGVAVGLWFSTSPVVTAVVVAILASVLMEVVRERGSTSGDVALALLFYGGIAGGVFITGLAVVGVDGLHMLLQRRADHFFGKLNAILSMLFSGFIVEVIGLCRPWRIVRAKVDRDGCHSLGTGHGGRFEVQVVW